MFSNYEIVVLTVTIACAAFGLHAFRRYWKYRNVKAYEEWARGNRNFSIGFAMIVAQGLIVLWVLP